jgi:hypothetical protein
MFTNPNMASRVITQVLHLKPMDITIYEIFVMGYLARTCTTYRPSVTPQPSSSLLSFSTPSITHSLLNSWNGPQFYRFTSLDWRLKRKRISLRISQAWSGLYPVLMQFIYGAQNSEFLWKCIYNLPCTGLKVKYEYRNHTFILTHFPSTVPAQCCYNIFIQNFYTSFRMSTIYM